ncbi:MAG: hypothetical protein ABSF09_14090 [Candidatus Bathyarchaeia archaeon]
MSDKSRPMGIVILAILEALVGIYHLATGFGDLFVAATIRSFSYFGIPSSSMAMIPRVLGTVLIIIGLASLLIAWGLWTGKPWARLVALVFVILSIIASVVAYHLVGIVIDAIIIYYLTRPDVKQFFTK